MTYAKLRQDGGIEYPPKTYKDENTVIYNFSDSPTMMRKKGFLEIVSDEMPDIPEGKMIVSHYQLIEPIATTTIVPIIDEEGHPILDEQGNPMTTEDVSYDIPEAYIKETFEIVDIPQEDLISDSA